MRIFIILILLCNIAFAKPVRIQNRAKIDRQKMLKRLNPKLLTKREISKLTNKEVKAYLEEITRILNELIKNENLKR